MKENKRILKRRERGITLIALVITIIVLLILAGVSISMLTGDNGIITQAQNAKNKTEEAARKEEQDLAELEAIITGKDVVITPVHDDNPGELEQEGSDTFVINSIEDLVFFSYDVTNGNDYSGKTVKLGTNLDFNSDKSYVDPNRTDFSKYGYNGPLKQSLTSGTGFSPIGSQDGTNGFYGTFDGNNNAICSLYIYIKSNDTNAKNAGLFLTTYGEIKNLGLVDVDITAQLSHVGGLTVNSYNDIYNCYVTGNINVTGYSWINVGGLCGIVSTNDNLESVNIENCYNLANINITNIEEENKESNTVSGGIVGQIEGKSVNMNKCFNKGNIEVNGGNYAIYIGGISGSATKCDSTNVKNCYNIGKIQAKNNSEEGSYIGGILGTLGKGNLSYCYNSGEIIVDIGNAAIGGVMAVQFNNSITENVYNFGKIIYQKDNSNLSIGGIIAFTDGGNNIEINYAYNLGLINLDSTNSNKIGSIIANSYNVQFNNCYYLKGTYDVGVDGDVTSTGITELDSIDKFPSVLEVVNGEGAFEEDSSNVNNGYPVLKMD